MSQKNQPQPPAYRLLAGDELGVLRVVEVPAGPKWAEAAMTQKWGEPDKQRAVCSMCCSTTPTSSSSGGSDTPGTAGNSAVLVAVGRRGRLVELLDGFTGTTLATWTAAARAAAAGAAAATSSRSANKDDQVHVAAVAFIPAAEDRSLQLVVGTSDGVVSICSDSSATASKPSSGSSSSWGVVGSFEVGSNITCMAVDQAGSHLLIGSEGHQPSLWELSTGSRVWQAKGGKPNNIGLVDKAHTTALAFLNSSSTTAGTEKQAAAAAAAGKPGNASQGQGTVPVARRFVAGSVSAKLLLYDTSVGKRPQLEVVFGETRVTSLAPEGNGLRVWAANGMGHVQQLDLQQKKLLGALKGAGGSVRELALINPGGDQQSLVASAGLDRFLRVHDSSTGACSCRVYLKQQLTALCWLPVPQASVATAAAGAAAAVPGGEQPAAAEQLADHQKHQQQQQQQKKRKKGSHNRRAAGDSQEGCGGAADMPAVVGKIKKHRS